MFLTNIRKIFTKMKQDKFALIAVLCFLVLGLSIFFFIQCFSKPFIGIVLTYNDDNWSVVADAGGLADQAGIRDGDRPVEVNGLPAETFLAKYTPVGSVSESVVYDITVVNAQGQSTHLSINDPPSSRANRDIAVYLLTSLIFWLVGFYVYFKRENDPAAVLLCVCGAVVGLAFSSTMAAVRYVPTALTFSIVASVIAPWVLVHFFLVLPQERAWTRSSPWVYGIYAPAAITLILYPFIGYAEGQALPDFRAFRLVEYALGLMAVAVVAGYNYFKALSPRMRQQMKIVFISCSIALIPFLLFYLLPVVIWQQTVIPSAFSVLFAAIVPLGLGVAVVTQRLLDIDIIIRRGVIYSLIAIVMACILSIAIFPIFAIEKSINTPEKILIVLALSGLATALLGPIRKAVEILVDRLFYQDRFDYRQTIQTLANSLTVMKDLSEVSRLIVGTPVHTLKLAGGCLIVRKENSPFSVTAAEGLFKEGDKQTRFALHVYRRNTAIEFPQRATSTDPDLAYIVPLFADDRQSAFLFLSHKINRQEFSRDDIFLIQGLASVGATALRSAILIHDVSLRDTFVMTASHELRIPLTGITVHAESLANNDYPEEVRQRKIQVIRDCTRKITDIVDDLLNVARIQSGRIIFKKEVVQVPSLVQERLAIIRENTAKHQFSIQSPPGLPDAIVDRDKFGLILDNLLSNAVKYSPRGGCVTVTVEEDPFKKRIVVGITDEGIGIAPEDKTNLFKTFTRIYRQETSNVRGSGLGLFIVKEWIEAMNGEVWVESELNKGSTFFVAVPIQETRQDQIAAREIQSNSLKSGAKLP
jgi:signal transduction histidine kinase